MAYPPVLQDQSLPGLLTAVAAEPDAASLELSSAVRREGWESVVLESDAWIIRFPRYDDEERFATELAVLQHVAGRLPVRTPEVAWTGRRTRCMAYPKITGTAFAPAQWHTAPDVDRQRLAGSLADLIVAWAELFAGTDADQLGVTAMDGAPYLRQLRSSVETFDAAMRPHIEDLLQVYERLYDDDFATRGPVVVHGDFHLGNMVLDRPCGAVTGLWDFSCVASGSSVWDLHYLAGELDDPAADPAPLGTGRHLDLLAAVTARLPGRYLATDTVALLSDLMQAVEWIGDHPPQDAQRWERQLRRLVFG